MKREINGEYLMNGNNQFLGIVKNGQFQLLQPEDLAGTTVRLTRIQMQEAISVESGEVDLTESMKERQSWSEEMKAANGYIRLK